MAHSDWETVTPPTDGAYPNQPAHPNHPAPSYGTPHTYTTPEGFENVGGFVPQAVLHGHNQGPSHGGPGNPHLHGHAHGYGEVTGQGLGGALEDRKREDGDRGVVGDVLSGVLGGKKKKKNKKSDSDSSSSSSDSDDDKKKHKHSSHNQHATQIPPYQPVAPPPAYAPPVTAPAGQRIPLETKNSVNTHNWGPPVASDLGGQPLYLCSVILDSGVHPAKAGPHLQPPVRYSYGGQELSHNGRYDILPWNPEKMVWIPATHGKPPQGWENRIVEGGYEDGGKLWHARTKIDGCFVLGKTAVHLGGANFPFGGREVVKRDGYDILCWK